MNRRPFCLKLSRLLRFDSLGYLDAYRCEPVVTVGREAVDDVEKFIVDGRRDGTHLSVVSDEDSVDRAEMGDLSGGSCEEGFVADVEQFARQRLLDDFDSELTCDRDDRVAGDSAEDGVCERCCVE